MQLGNV